MNKVGWPVWVLESDIRRENVRQPFLPQMWCHAYLSEGWTVCESNRGSLDVWWLEHSWGFCLSDGVADMNDPVEFPSDFLYSTASSNYHAHQPSSRPSLLFSIRWNCNILLMCHKHLGPSFYQVREVCSNNVVNTSLMESPPPLPWSY